MNENRRDVLQICLINGLFVFFVYKPEPDSAISERIFQAMAAKLIAGPAEHMTWSYEDPMVTQDPADVIACLKNPFTRRIFPMARIVERGDKDVSITGDGYSANFHNYYRVVNVD